MRFEVWGADLQRISNAQSSHSATSTILKRMRFRFSIRDLLWLTLVVALAAAWWLDPLGVFVAIPIAASAPLAFLVGSKAHGRLRFKIVVASLFATGWIGDAIYLEALRVAFYGRSSGQPDIPRLIAIVCALPAFGTSVLLWRTWVRSANETIQSKSD